MSDAKKITLHYFDFKGRGEVSRLLLHAAGKQFEDHKVAGPDWPKMKPNMPFGHLPVLEVDGELFGQSHAFNRYIAVELGLGPKNNREGLRCDQVTMLWEDLLRNCSKGFFEQDAAKKAELVKSISEGEGIRVQSALEKLLKENGTGYFIGSRLTLAEIYAFDLHTGSIGDYLGPLDAFPLLKANIEKTRQNKGVAAYMATRK